MKKPIPYIALASLLLVAASSSLPAADAPPVNLQPGTVIAEINGEKLTLADFQAYIRMRMSHEKQPKKLDKAERQKIFGEYINRELLYQEAVKKGMDKNAIVDAEIQNQRRNIVVSYTLQQLMRSPPKESEIKAVYEQEVATPNKEYKTRHILVKTEQQARDIIAELDSGKNFMQLATQRSIDASAKRGGELGWFSASQMIEPYGEAATRLSNGSYTHTPVETRFGWHVIRLDGTREIPPPSYEEMRDKIIARINNRRIATYIASLRKNADVTVASMPDEPQDREATTAASRR